MAKKRVKKTAGQHTSRYVVWEAMASDDNCIVSDIDNLEDDYELKKGISRAEGFPDNVVLYMDDDHPDATLIPDNVFNLLELIIVSKRLKEFLAKLGIENVEYLPVTILNHDESVGSSDHHIVHPVGLTDCLLVDECGPKWSKILKDRITHVDRLVIDEASVPENQALVRLQHYHRVVLVRRDIAEAVEREGFTGIRWVEIDDYPE
jgi:hypothetical protein